MIRQPRKVGKLARELFHKQDGICHYCHEPMTLRRGSSKTATVDHKFPKSLGGTKHASNTVGACFECNNAKGDRPYEEFLRDAKKKRQPSRRSTKPSTPRATTVGAGPWKRDRLKTRPYLSEIGKHTTLADAIIAAGLVTKDD